MGAYNDTIQHKWYTFSDLKYLLKCPPADAEKTVPFYLKCIFIGVDFLQLFHGPYSFFQHVLPRSDKSCLPLFLCWSYC